MKETGVGMATRLAVIGIKPRLIVDEISNEWTVRVESTIKTMGYKFVPGVEFNETTFDGREVKVWISWWSSHLLDYLSFLVDYNLFG